jgi:hypothetical protein
MLTNPGFEDGGGSYDGWFTWEGTVEISTAAGDNIMRTGLAASKCYGEFTGCPGSGFFTDGGFGQAFTSFTVGNVYTLGGYSYVSSADTIPGTDNCNHNRLIAKVVFFNATSGGSEISGNEIVIGDYSTPRDEWIEFSISAIAPPGALRMEALFIILQPECDEGAVFVDDTYLHESAPVTESNVLANPSFDSDLSGWVTFGNVYRDARSWAVHTPPGCAQLYGTFSGGSDSGMFQEFSATEGSLWSMGTNAMTTCRNNDPIEADNTNFITAKLTFLDADSVELDWVEQVILDNTAPVGSWVHHELRSTAPTRTEFVRAYILFFQEDTTLAGSGWVDDISLCRVDTLSTAAETMPVAQGITLYQNVPNPFNPTTRIDFELEKGGWVDLKVYDVAGRLVAKLFQGHLGEGAHKVTWNGKTSNGTTAAAGVYLYVLRTETGMASRRMVLLR